MQEILKELALATASAATAALVAFAKMGIDYLREWLIAKTNKTVYENALAVAKGMYTVLEDKYNVSGMGSAKRQEMNRKLLNLFPSLTSDELDAINKDICNQFKYAIKEGIEGNEDDK